MKENKFPDGELHSENNYNYWIDEERDDKIGEKDNIIFIDSMLLVDKENTVDFKHPKILGQAIDVISFLHEHNYYVYLLKDSVIPRIHKDTDISTKMTIWDIQESLEEQVQKKSPNFMVKCNGYVKYRGEIRSSSDKEYNGVYYRKGQLYMGGDTNVISRFFWFNLEIGLWGFNHILCCPELRRLESVGYDEVMELFGRRTGWFKYFTNTLSELEMIAVSIDSNYFNTITPNRTEESNRHSTGEREVLRILKQNNINFSTQARQPNINNYYRFDFEVALPNGKTAYIEYDGLQHFIPIDFFGGKKSFSETRARDMVKNNYCFQTKTPLLRIRDDQFDKIESMVLEFMKKTDYTSNFNPEFSNDEYYNFSPSKQQVSEISKI